MRHVPRLLAMLTLVTAGCSVVPQVDERGLYKADAGPYTIRVADPVVLNDRAQGRDLSVRVAYPDGAGPFPVVLFSHGAFCFADGYASVTDHWVSHGYVVVLPRHLDAADAPPLGPEALPRLLQARLDDLAFLLDHLAELRAVAGIEGELDAARIAVAGHSFGGMIAMIKAGLYLRAPDSGERLDFGDARIRAAVVMSGVGPMPQMTDDAFSGLKKPLLATGGTLDVGNIGSGPVYPWEWRMSAFGLAPSGDKFQVVLDRGDHYLGGLICRQDRGGPPDPEGAAIDRAVATAFLDAYLRDEPAARAFLDRADLAAITAGRARLERK